MRPSALLFTCALPLALAFYAFTEARRMPVVREATITLPEWPKNARPINAVLIADIHIGNATMDAARLTRIVDRIDALKPDLVLIAGDFVYGNDPTMGTRVADDLTMALTRLKPTLGTVAVLGNHDRWTGKSALLTAIRRAGITVLENDATVRGPVTIIGIDDHFTGQHDIDRAWSRADHLPGARVVLSHSPDIDYGLPKAGTLLLAGHSHCGQVQIPFYGPILWVTRDRKRCGLIREGPLRIIVTAGLGTSGLPFRLAAPPDLWLLHLGPARHGDQQRDLASPTSAAMTARRLPQ